ncbi:hypothetical protein [Nocardioides lentus]|uniref:hypothetical protein n=1 Tax=Nocardioides lentus TaxID=338077 RepID=UPI0031E195BF
MLAHTLIVRHPDTLVATPLVAGSEVPDWATSLVDDADLDGANAEPKRTRGRKAGDSST